MRRATRACRSFGLAHAIISRRLQSFVNSKKWAVRAIPILASGVLLTEHLNFTAAHSFPMTETTLPTIQYRRPDRSRNCTRWWAKKRPVCGAYCCMAYRLAVKRDGRRPAAPYKGEIDEAGNLAERPLNYSSPTCHAAH